MAKPSYKSRAYTVADLLDEVDKDGPPGLKARPARLSFGSRVGTPVPTPKRRAVTPTDGEKYTRGGYYLAAGIVFLIGVCTGSAAVFMCMKPSTSSEVAPEVVTETVIQERVVTVPRDVSSECREAIGDVQVLMDSASEFGSASSKILDLLSEAYTATYLGDTQKMNAASQGLRELERELTGDGVAVPQSYEPVMKGLESCLES